MCMRTHGGPLEGSLIVQAHRWESGEIWHDVYLLAVGPARAVACLFPTLEIIMPGGAVLLKAQGREIDPYGILPHPWLGKGKLEFK